MASAATTKPIQVLVVEDHEDDFRYLSFLLGRRGTATYQLSWASSYAAGQQLLQRGGFDVGLFDYQLGGGTGIDLLREAREAGCAIPIILLTGHDSAEVDQEASQAGAADYLCKTGLNGTELERTIRFAMRQAAMTAALRQSQQQLELFMRSVPCAVCIRDSNGQLLFQNELFARFFNHEGLQPIASPSSAVDAWPYSHDGRHWLVNSFAMVSEKGERLQGIAALDITERVQMENELHRTTSLVRSIMRSLPSVLGRLDDAGRVVEAQGTGLERIRLNADALVGQVLADKFPQGRAAIAQALRGEAANFSVTGNVDEQEWQVDFFVTADSDRLGGLTFFGRDVTERRWLEQRLLTISDAEQQRIGADLHDGLGQQLTGIACLAAAMRDRLKKSAPPEVEQADLIARLASESVSQSRALARGLCPVQLERASLASALEDLTYQAQVLHGVECRFRAEGATPHCEHLAAIHLYRITQEAIHNAARHGGAKHVLVTLTTRGGQHTLTIKDDGRGFDPGAVRLASGAGLRLMGYRANMIGGTFSAESSPGRGTQVSVLFTSASAK
jgi:signal transduction histidine kinase/FixJ family two-component response regulator